jgi:hypothetical protein
MGISTKCNASAGLTETPAQAYIFGLGDYQEATCLWPTILELWQVPEYGKRVLR